MSHSPRVLLVDWLGQGGIAQVTDAVRMTLLDSGCDVRWVTRGGGEFTGDVTVPLRGSKIAAHRAVAVRAAREIAEWRPDVVFVEGHIIPWLESALYRAAHHARCRLVVVVHDHAPHSVLEASTVGLKGHLLQADVVVCHTRFVAAGVQALTGRTDIVTVSHPLSRVAHRLAYDDDLPPRTAPPVAVHFGVLKRGYKGTQRVVELAWRGVPPWRFEIIGVGAPALGVNVVSESRFPSAEELAARVARATAALLPYRWATQSGAVVLAQAAGTVPVATAVGGLPEQIEDGVTGLLLSAAAPLDDWIAALERLEDPALFSRISSTARETVRRRHLEFRRDMAELAGVSQGP